MKIYVSKVEVERYWTEEQWEVPFGAWTPEKASSKINEFLEKLFERDCIEEVLSLDYPLLWLTFLHNVFSVYPQLPELIQARIDRSNNRLETCDEAIQSLGRENAPIELHDAWERAMTDRHNLHTFLTNMTKEQKIEQSVQTSIEDLGEFGNLAYWMRFEWGEWRWNADEPGLNLERGKAMSLFEAQAGEILAYLQTRFRHPDKPKWKALCHEVQIDALRFKENQSTPGLKWLYESKYKKLDDMIGFYLFKHLVGDDPWRTSVELWRQYYASKLQDEHSKQLPGRRPSFSTSNDETLVRHARLLYNKIYPGHHLSPIWEKILVHLCCCSGIEIYPIEKWRSFRKWVVSQNGWFNEDSNFVMIGDKKIYP